MEALSLHVSPRSFRLGTCLNARPLPASSEGKGPRGMPRAPAYCLCPQQHCSFLGRLHLLGLSVLHTRKQPHMFPSLGLRTSRLECGMPLWGLAYFLGL